MKLLHIGKTLVFERYTEQTEFTKSITCLSMPAELPAGEYLSRMPDADFIIADAIADVTAEVINGMPDLKLIHSEGVAFNRIDVKAAAERHIYVCNAAGVNAQSVAEQTLLLILGVLHDVISNDKAVRDGRQGAVKETYMTMGTLPGLAGSRVGLIGFGHTGQAAAKLLKACKTETFYTQRKRQSTETEEECGAVWLPSIDEILNTCDIISLHLPVTPETRGMCDEAFFNKMRPGSFFINTSRGELVNDHALVNAIKNGKIAMAGLDTLNDEPVQKDHFLINQPEDIARRLLFSPHIGGATASNFYRSYKIIWDNIRRVAEGETPINVVNLR